MYLQPEPQPTSHGKHFLISY